MNKLFNLNIRSKLTIFISLLVLIILIGISITLYIVLSGEIATSKEVELQHLATSNAGMVKSEIKGLKEQVKALAENEVLTDGKHDIDDIITIYQGFADERSISMFSIADNNGNAIALNSDKTNVDVNDREYYKLAMSGETSISDIIVAKDTGNLIFAVASPIYREGQVDGVLIAILDGSFLNTYATNLAHQAGDSGIAYFINSEGKTVGHVNPDHVMNGVNPIEMAKKNDAFKDLADKLQSDILVKDAGTVHYIYDGNHRMLGYSKIENTPWIFVNGLNESEAMNILTTILRVLSIAGIIGINVGFVVAFFVGNNVANPIKALAEETNSMANYNMQLTGKGPASKYGHRQDEIGIIARSLRDVKIAMSETLGKVNEVANSVSASSQQLNATSEQSASSAEDLANVIDEIAKGAMMQAEDMQVGTEAMQVMHEALDGNEASINNLNDTSKTVEQAKESGINIVKELTNATAETNKASNGVLNSIQNTSDSVHKIEEAADMIKSIADQTNLLALNAAIEAARAGEAGRGFAVVAEEIRKLAEQSTAFTEEISNVVGELTTNTNHAVKLMNDMKSIRQMQSDKVSETSEQFNIISTELEKTDAAVEAINTSKASLIDAKIKMLDIIGNLSALSQENAASAEESAASVQTQTAKSEEIANSSQHLAEMAQELAKMVSVFKF